MLMPKIKNHKKYILGFTLVETLVAVSIFSISILGLIAVLGGGISDIGYAKKKMTASYLAQEGIEYMRNLRDTYALYGGGPAGWDAFKSKVSSCATANGCYFDDRNVLYTDSSMPITDLLISSCTNSQCGNAELLYNPVNHKYGYLAGSNSGYYRKINISPVGGANEVKLTSTVYWTQGSGTYNASFSESLFNWIE